MKHYVRCAKWRRRSGKLAVCLGVVTLAHWCGVARAATAFAECIEDSGTHAGTGQKTPAKVALSDGLTMAFRVEPARGWTLDSAVLLLHIAEGRPPSELSGAGRKPMRVVPKEGGWIQMDVPLELASELVSGARATLSVRAKKGNALVHTRESQTWIPYLVVSGTPPNKR